MHIRQSTPVASTYSKTVLHGARGTLCMVQDNLLVYSSKPLIYTKIFDFNLCLVREVVYDKHLFYISYLSKHDINLSTKNSISIKLQIKQRN